MLCSVCKKCGLCPGDKSFIPSKNLISEDSLFFADSLKPALCPVSDVGIAVDIGTTTIAAVSVELCTLRVCAKTGAENEGRQFGSDVMSRVMYALNEEGLNHERLVMQNQIKTVIQNVFNSAKSLFLKEGRRDIRLTKIVLTGNTAMLSILCGYSVEGLSRFPFSVSGKFGFALDAEKILGSVSKEFASCPVYIPPVISAFVGSDTVCAMLACSFLHSRNFVLLADLGTNCEIALFNPVTKKISVSSCAAGPAFEAGGIAMGMPSVEGAVSRVFADGKNFACDVLGGSKAKGFCATGLLSAVSCFLQSGVLDSQGSFLGEEDFIDVCGGVGLYQKDVRAFQLAKAACLAGIQILLERENVNASEIDALFLAGGFGTKLDAEDAARCKMIPPECSGRVVQAGNAALSGAVMLLVSEAYRDECESLCAHSTALDLAACPDFSSKFIDALSF